MKANEVRLGNYILNDDKVLRVVEINSIKIEAISMYEKHRVFYEYAKPIPLTEEWLLKFNFEIEEIHAGLSEADFGHNSITQDFILTIKNTGSGWFYRNSHFKLNYVHQLQNLYFALCGEELELKETNMDTKNKTSINNKK